MRRGRLAGATWRERYASKRYLRSDRRPSSVVFLHFPWTDRNGTRPPETDYYYISNESKLATMGESEIQAKIDEIGELSLFCFAEK